MGVWEGLILNVLFGLALERQAEKEEKDIPCQGNRMCKGKMLCVICMLTSSNPL